MREVRIVLSFFFLMIRLPPRSTRTDTLFPYTTLFRSNWFSVTIIGVSAMGSLKVAAEGPLRSKPVASSLAAMSCGVSSATAVLLRLPVGPAKLRAGSAEIVRASCRERVCQYVYISVYVVSLTHKQIKTILDVSICHY